MKAVEQLGSDKAPVRMGGLYALERLAQDNPPQRQMIVEVRLIAQRILTRHLRPWLDEASDRDPKFWPGMDIDLSGATLVEFRLRKAMVARPDFVDAVFHGRAEGTRGPRAGSWSPIPRTGRCGGWWHLHRPRPVRAA